MAGYFGWDGPKVAAGTVAWVSGECVSGEWVSGEWVSGEWVSGEWAADRLVR